MAKKKAIKYISPYVVNKNLIICHLTHLYNIHSKDPVDVKYLIHMMIINVWLSVQKVQKTTVNMDNQY